MYIYTYMSYIAYISLSLYIYIYIYIYPSARATFRERGCDGVPPGLPSAVVLLRVLCYNCYYCYYYHCYYYYYYYYLYECYYDVLLFDCIVQGHGNHVGRNHVGRFTRTDRHGYVGARARVAPLSYNPWGFGFQGLGLSGFGF